MDFFVKIFLVYLLLINVISIIVCIYDKIMAIKQKFRVSEAALFWLSFLGGAVFMFITMKLIRHKTLHKKFMIGLPLIIIFQAALVLFFTFYIDKIL